MQNNKCQLEICLKIYNITYILSEPLYGFIEKQNSDIIYNNTYKDMKNLLQSTTTQDRKCRVGFLERVLVVGLFLASVKCSFIYGEEQASPSANFTQLNYELELLDSGFLTNWQESTANLTFSEFNSEEMGSYLFILGKMHLYGILPSDYPQRSYLLAYHYLQMAAELYESADAYYYLSLMEYMRITPGIAIKNGIKSSKQQSKPINEDEDDLLVDIDSHHLHSIEQNLFISSLMGHSSAKLSLAYMLKDGIGTNKNCSAALAYYLSEVRENRVDVFQFPSDYQDESNFEYNLYCREKVDLSKYGEEDASALIDTLMFDTDSIKAYEEVAMNYLTGENGTPLNEKKAADMFMKMQDQSKLSRIMLAFMYLKGRGVEINYEKARKIFERESKEGSQVAEETLIVMRYFEMGFSSTRLAALEEMRTMFKLYELRVEMEQNRTKKQVKRQKLQIFRTPTIKYLTGSLVLSGDIKGLKKNAIIILEEAAKDGNTMALIQMGLLFVDGSDLNFDCFRAVEFFSKQALSHKVFQNRIQLAKIGIKKNLLMFSFTKYVQLMMVGYRNSFINSMYLYQVYHQEVFNFNENSWSVSFAREDPIYKNLIFTKSVIPVQEMLSKLFNPSGETEIISKKQMGNYSVMDNGAIGEHLEYIRTKILTIGITKHDISILKFFKYKKTKEPILLHRLADLGENSFHVLESRFLLGKYYHHTEITDVSLERREKRALEEYRRATKNKFLADLIFSIEGGDLKETGKIGSDLMVYLTVILALAIFCYYKKNKALQIILQSEAKKETQEEASINYPSFTGPNNAQYSINLPPTITKTSQNETDINFPLQEPVGYQIDDSQPIIIEDRDDRAQINQTEKIGGKYHTQ